MGDLLIKLLLTAALTLLIKGAAAVLAFSIAWWMAALIALVLVFGGWFIVVDSDGAWD